MRSPKKPVTAVPIVNPLARLSVLGISSGLGLGLMPVAPGTFGSLLGIPLGILFLRLPNEIALGLAVVLFLFFSWLAEKACRHWGDMDCGRVVSDEVLGQGLAMLGLRYFIDPITGYPSIIMVGVSFLLFRILDIVKPYPAKMFDRQPSGFGVVADDVVAGLYAALVLVGYSKILGSG